MARFLEYPIGFMILNEEAIQMLKYKEWWWNGEAIFQ